MSKLPVNAAITFDVTCHGQRGCSLLKQFVLHARGHSSATGPAVFITESHFHHSTDH
jgi:hypothetical protein